jgi:DNA modification methylase
MIHTITGIHLGDGGKGMAGMPARSVDLTVTSPPYGSLRLYGGHTCIRLAIIFLVVHHSPFFSTL